MDHIPSEPINIVPLEQCHCKPVGMYGDSIFKFAPCATLRRPPPYIPIGW